MLKINNPNPRNAGRKAQLTPDQTVEVLELHRKGIGNTEIAKQFGVSRQTIYKYIYNAEHFSKNPDFTMRMNFMNGQQLCTVIDIDFKHEVVRMKNYTDRIPLRAFGVVENPSWADFEDFGNITLSESTMDYIKSLDNAVVGHAYTSVFGAGTSTSEFEFLTGDSMAFLPSGSIPYQQYILGASDSLATLLKGYGYETRAFHPGEKTSWQRNMAYPRLGFDSFKCGDDMDVPQTDEHGYVSDDSDFRQVIWEFEHKQEGTPLFLFNVTIQNHGAYTVEDYPAEVTVEDAPGAYPKAEQYLTLANKTDEAFRQLVEYFEQQTEPTIIVMFGDHQPSVEQEFLDMAYGVSEDGMTMEQYMDKFQVPFVIWANYPLTGEKPGITSLNFLAQYVLRDAGIQTSAFGSYLWNLTKTIPAMTFAGYFDSEGNAYSHLETTEMTDLIRQYQTVQYNELFGGADRQSSLFAAPVS